MGILLNSSKSATAVLSPDLMSACEDLVNLISQSSERLSFTPARSGPTSLPAPMLWQAAHAFWKICLPDSCADPPCAPPSQPATSRMPNTPRQRDGDSVEVSRDFSFCCWDESRMPLSSRLIVVVTVFASRARNESDHSSRRE